MNPRRLLESSSPSSTSRILTTGLVAICLVGIGIEVAPESGESPSLVPDGFRTAFALPVPEGTEVVARSIEPKRWRSLLVLDLDPIDPPDWIDTVLVVRLRPIPGVLLCRATTPCDLPEGGAGASAWWSFGSRLGVRTSSHASVVEAVRAARTDLPSENPSASSGEGDATATSDPSPGTESSTSIPVGVAGNR